MTRIFKIGSVKITEDSSMAGLSLDEIRVLMSPVHSIRIADALTCSPPAVRAHDGVHLVER